MELSFDCLKSLNSLQQKKLVETIGNLQRKHRNCENKSGELDLLTSDSIWIHKEKGVNWCFKIVEIPNLIKSGKNPFTGKKFTATTIKKMEKIQIGELRSYAHMDKWLPIVYSGISKRQDYITKIKNNLLQVHNALQPTKQCLSDPKKRLLDYLRARRKISYGSYGTVSEAAFPKGEDYPFRFAIKETRISKDSLKTIFDPKNRDWLELVILRDYINPLIEKQICPNLPLLIDTFTCEQCKMKLINKDYAGPCSISILELANGTMKEFLNSSPNELELYSALFQILAALHTVQYYYQLFHRDIKHVNILYYNVPSGGYWLYTIHGKDYYVPNIGKLFILNDFGVCRIYYPGNPIGNNVGTRYCVIMNGVCLQIDIDENSVPLKNVEWNKNPIKLIRDQPIYQNKVAFGKNLKLSPNQVNFLKSANIPLDTESPDFYKYSEIIPPLEFRYDIQDVLRIFVGGPRTAQSGDHHKYPLPAAFKKRLLNYVDNNIYNYISGKAAHYATAGYMIEELFSNWLMVQSPLIESYSIS